MEDKVLLKVKDIEVKKSDVDKFIITMGNEGVQFDNEEGRKQIATELMNQHLIYLDAVESGLENDEDFQKELQIAKEQILRQFAMKKVLDSVYVTDEEINDFYNSNLDRFKKIYSYRASHILVETEEHAKNLKSKIDSGESFEELAKSNSKCPSSEQGGDLGLFSSGQMVKEFEDTCNLIEVGTVSEPVKTQFGYHLVKLVEKHLARDDDFESNKADIKNILLGKKQQEAYLEKTNSLQEKYGVEKNF